MDTDQDRRVFDSVLQTKDFVYSVLQRDELPDWNLAKDLGELMIRIAPDFAIGHALVARACRHLGDLDRARGALQRCRALAMGPGESDVLMPLLADEEKHLCGAGPPAAQR